MKFQERSFQILVSKTRKEEDEGKMQSIAKYLEEMGHDKFTNDQRGCCKRHADVTKQTIHDVEISKKTSPGPTKELKLIEMMNENLTELKKELDEVKKMVEEERIKSRARFRKSDRKKD